MTARFDLVVTADYPSRTAEFRLLDGAGNQLAYRQTDFRTIPAGRQQGLFDLRDYLRLYVDEAGQRAALGEIGVCIAEQVLGKTIFGHLWAARTQRTLRIQLPGAAERESPLAAALARVPWELARPQAAAESLAERNLLVRIVHERQDPASSPMDLAPDEPLRVLFFYRALLADPRPKDAAAALTLARRALLAGPAQASAWFQVCDHATPVPYGEEEPGLTLRPGRGSAPAAQRRRLHQIAELTTAAHPHFVGRTWELARLGSDFIGTGPGAQTCPVAVIVGRGGMGKTALAAEALDLWEQGFTWVLTWQAKPSPLAFDAWLRDLHLKLWGELGRYHDQVQAHPADAVHRNPEPGFTGPERLARLIHNLVLALQDESILLVLDNFETNLKPRPEGTDPAGADPVWAARTRPGTSVSVHSAWVWPAPPPGS